MKKTTRAYKKLTAIVEHTLAELLDKVIIKVGNKYVLYNKYTIAREIDHVVVFKRDNYESYEFNYMKNAMIWVLLDVNKKPSERNRIYRLDKELTSIEIDKKIHPTQKPVALYDWTLQNFAKEGDLILDTHLGGGSIRISCDKGGFNFTGFEIDKQYFDEQENRFKQYKRQLRLF